MHILPYAFANNIDVCKLLSKALRVALFNYLDKSLVPNITHFTCSYEDVSLKLNTPSFVSIIVQMSILFLLFDCCCYCDSISKCDID